MDLPVILVGTRREDMVDRCGGCGQWRMIYRDCSACGRPAAARLPGVERKTA